MPIDKQSSFVSTGNQFTDVEPLNDQQVSSQQDPSFTQTVGAWFQRENVVYNLYDKLTDGIDSSTAQQREDFDVYSHIPEENLEYADMYWNATDLNEVELVNQKVRREKANNEIIHNSGFSTNITAALLTGIVDPTILIPGSAFYKVGKGANAVKNFTQAATVTAALTAGEEVILHDNQATRTTQESLYNLLGATMFGGSIGALTGKIANNQIKTTMKAIEEKQIDPKPYVHDIGVPTAGSNQHLSSAGATEILSEADEKLVSNFGVSKVSLGIPENVIDNFNGQTVKALGELYGGSASYRVKNKAGVANRFSLSERTMKYEALEYKASSELKNIYHQYRGSSPDNAITQKQFYDQVAKAARRGDIDGDPAVTKAARLVREKIYDPLLEQMVELDIIAKDIDIKTAKSYVNRIWDKAEIMKNSTKFLDITKQWIKQNNPDFHGSDVDSIAHNIYSNIVHGDGGLRTNIAGGGSITKSRVFDIPDDMVEQFLENDIEMAIHEYTRQAARLIEDKKMLRDEIGVESFDEALDLIRDEFHDMRKTAIEQGDDVKKLEKDYESQVKYITDIRNREHGSFGMAKSSTGEKASRISSAVRKFNTITDLVNLALMALPDIARPVSEASIKHAVPVYKKYLSDKAFRDLSTNNAKHVIGILEVVNNKRLLAQVSEHSDPYKELSLVEKAIDKIFQQFPRVTVIGPWNQHMKTIAAVSMESKLTSIIKKVGRSQATSAEIEEIARWGISKNNAKAMAQLIKQHGEVVEGGVHMSKFADWSDPYLQEVMINSLAKVSANVIATPTGSNLPLFMSHGVGKVIGQFKSFAFAMHQQVLMPVLQKPTADRMMAITMAAAVGASVQELKDRYVYSKKREERTITDRLIDGVDNSGALAAFFLVNNTMEYAMHQGLRKWVGDSQRVRSYDSYGPSFLIGPSGNLVDEWTDIINDVTNGQVDGGTWNDFRNQIPFYKHWGLRWATKQLDQHMKETLD